jgi:hypothetical protein
MGGMYASCLIEHLREQDAVLRNLITGFTNLIQAPLATTPVRCF